MRLISPDIQFMPHMEYASMLLTVCTAVAHCFKMDIPHSQKEREEFIRRRMTSGHLSVIEHVGFTATFTVDRGVSHEMVRHRLASFTQESTRYCNYSKDKFDGQVTFIMPEFVAAVVPAGVFNTLELTPNAEKLARLSLVDNNMEVRGVDIEDHVVFWWLSGLLQAERHYMVLSDLGMDPNYTRGILPNATKTEITWTANMREWRHIFQLRSIGTTGRPHPQMVEVMTPLLNEAVKRFPVFFQDL